MNYLNKNKEKISHKRTSGNEWLLGSVERLLSKINTWTVEHSTYNIHNTCIVGLHVRDMVTVEFLLFVKSVYKKCSEVLHLNQMRAWTRPSSNFCTLSGVLGRLRMVWQASERRWWSLSSFSVDAEVSPQTEIGRSDVNSLFACSSKDTCLGAYVDMNFFSLFRYGELTPEVCRNILVIL